MSSSSDATGQVPLRAWHLARLHVGLLVLALLLMGSNLKAEDSPSSYWLKYGKPASLCADAQDDAPAKIEGASWGIIASGVILCRDLGASYAIKLDYLNVRIDPADRQLLKRRAVSFDWFGLALYRPGPSSDVDWLFDTSRPIKGELKRESAGRIVFSNLSFVVPKQQAEAATNMLFYLTFDGPVVAIRVL